MRRPLPLLLLLTACGHTAPAEPASQRVVYRIVDSTGVVSTTTVDVLPPYLARTVDRTADGRAAGGFAWDARGLYTLAADGTATRTASVAPGFPGPYSGLAVALPVAQEQHLVRRLGASMVLGRVCTRWLSKEPLDGAAFAAAAGGDRTESCVDASGRLLSDRWQIAGTTVRTRIATLAGAGPHLSGGALLGGQTPEPPSAEDYVVRASSAEELARLMQVPAPPSPAGLDPDQAVAVLDVAPGRTGFTREAAVLTWTGGGHLAVLRIERDLSGRSKGTVRGAPVALGNLGTGHLEPVLAGLRVVVDGPRGLRAIVTADLPREDLLRWVSALRFQTGP